MMHKVEINDSDEERISMTINVQIIHKENKWMKLKVGRSADIFANPLWIGKYPGDLKDLIAPKH